MPERGNAFRPVPSNTPNRGRRGRRRRARLPKSQRRADQKRFLRAYYVNVDAEDMAARDPPALASAALAHPEICAPGAAAAPWSACSNPSVLEQGYASPHTVIEVVNDDMPFLVDNDRARPRAPFAHHAFPGAPDLRRRARRAGVLRSIEERAAAAEQRLRLESFQHIEIDRTVDPEVLNALRSDIEHSMPRCARGASRLGQDARGGAADLRRSRFFELALRSTRCERGAIAALLDGGPALHFSRVQGVSPAHPAEGWMRSIRWRRPASGSCVPATNAPPSATRTLASDIRRQSRSRDPSARHQGEPAILGASGRLSRLRRREAFRRRGPAHRGAALSGTVDPRRPTTRRRGRFRWCATRWPKWCSILRSLPTATMARRYSTSWNRSLGMSCSRQACRI